MKTTKNEDDQKRRRPKMNMTKNKDDQKQRRPKMKTTKKEDNQKRPNRKNYDLSQKKRRPNHYGKFHTKKESGHPW